MSSYYSQHLSVCTHSVSVDLLTSCRLPVASLEWQQFATDNGCSSNGRSLACVVPSSLASTGNDAGGETKLLLIELKVEVKASERCSNFAKKFAATFSTIFGLSLFLILNLARFS